MNRRESIMELNIEEIMEILPHRYPMLLVDKITELVPMDYAVGVKSVTINEPFFQGHFPGHPIMPGALICEAMAQVGGVALQYPEENRGPHSHVYRHGQSPLPFPRPPGRPACNQSGHQKDRRAHGQGTL